MLDIEALSEAAHNAWLAEKQNRGVTTWPNFPAILPPKRTEEYFLPALREVEERVGLKTAVAA